MARLSPREEQVLALLGRAMRGRDIASALGIAEFTVRKHRASIMRKLGLQTAVQLIAHAIKMGGRGRSFRGRCGAAWAARG